MEKLPTKIRITSKSAFAGDTGLSKRQIVGFFCRYADEIPEYPWNPDLEYRAEYLEACLAYLAPDVQRQALLDLCDYDGEMAYGEPPGRDVNELRRWLTEAGPSPLAVAEPFVDRPFVQKQWQKALSEVDSDPEGAISTARSLLETVCKHLLEERGVTFKDDGDLPALFKTAVAVLDLAASAKASGCLKQMLGGAFSVMNGLAGLRNEFGDAHGKAKNYVGPDPRHARFAINSAGGLAMFLLETHEQQPDQAS